MGIDFRAGKGEARVASPGDEHPLDVGFLLVPGFPLMSYAAAVEPMRAANQLSGRALYRWWHASPDDRPVSASNGVAILPDVGLGDAKLAAARFFICAGGNPSAFDDARVFDALRRLARRGTAIGGISGGPYALARAGLLDGRRCTLHWEHIPAFQESFPKVRVARSLFEIDGDRITCSGGIAALDMMLRLIAEDHGGTLAAEVGDWFLHDQIREGPSPQRMSVPLRLGVRDPRLVRVLEAIDSHLERPLSRQALAGVACVSQRQLERLFAAALGRTLHQYYLQQRLARAYRLERETVMSLAEIAGATGFSSGMELRRAQRRVARGSPDAASVAGR
jgi:transcriptional regulator GlxA family with amidase domain